MILNVNWYYHVPSKSASSYTKQNTLESDDSLANVFWILFATNTYCSLNILSNKLWLEDSV